MTNSSNYPFALFFSGHLGGKKKKKNKISVKKRQQDWASKHLHNEETRERNGANICEMRLKAKYKERNTELKDGRKEEKMRKATK